MTKIGIIAFSLLLCKVVIGAPPQGASAGAPVGLVAISRPIAPVPPGVIPPDLGCSDDDASTGFINDPCKADADCYDVNSMTCTSGKCQCAKNFVEDPSLPKDSKRRTCSSVPSLYMPCTLASGCQKPYECKAQTAEFIAPEGGAGNICQCPGKSKYVNGICDAGCKDGQRVGNGGECVAKCTKDQILINNDCQPMADLGGKCSDATQCKAAFSTCSNGKCACANGFTAQGTKCQPKTYNCPFGDPLKKGDSVVQCTNGQGGFPVCTPNAPCPMAALAGGASGAPPPEKMAPNANGASVSSMPPPRPYKTDSCPSSHYCYNYDYSGQARGHCCPKPAPKCPVGDAILNTTCSGESGKSPCPYTTHTCMNVGAPGDYSGNLCCPKPCAGYETVFVKDQCLPYAQYGDACQANEQCVQHNGVCTNGKCACSSRATIQNSDSPYKFCQVNCNSDEIQLGNECKPRFKLGDSCTNDNAQFCPSGAFCNKKGVCSCLCGYQKLTDKFCAPQPSCPSPPPFGVASSSSSSSSGSKTFTYCKLSSTRGKPPVDAVDSCPAKSYCSYYVENMGVCCPQPDPYCPDGSKPRSTQNCHQINPTISAQQQCGPNEFCNIYLSSAATDDKGNPAQQASVCCPMNPPPIGVVPPGVPMPVPMQAPPPGAASAPVAASVSGNSGVNLSRKSSH